MEGFDCQTHFIIESVLVSVIEVEHKLIPLGK